MRSLAFKIRLLTSTDLPRTLDFVRVSKCYTLWGCTGFDGRPEATDAYREVCNP